MKKIVLDLETKNTFAEVGSREAAKLDLSVVSIYDYDDDKYYSYLEDELADLWEKLEKTDILIGYNLNKFDVPVLNKYYTGDLSRLKTIDLYEEIKKAAGKSLSLDLVAAGTLGVGKISHGLQAVSWWQEGKIDEIKKYCEDDVRITKEIYEFAKQNGFLKYKLLNDEYKFPIDTSEWEKVDDSQGLGGSNYQLPF